MSDGLLRLRHSLPITHYRVKGCLIFNNTEEVQPHYWQFAMVWLGLDCMYRPFPWKSSMGMGATQALK